MLDIKNHLNSRLKFGASTTSAAHLAAKPSFAAIPAAGVTKDTFTPSSRFAGPSVEFDPHDDAVDALPPEVNPPDQWSPMTEGLREAGVDPNSLGQPWVEPEGDYTGEN
jgi:hypothetical protein